MGARELCPLLRSRIEDVSEDDPSPEDDPSSDGTESEDERALEDAVRGEEDKEVEGSEDRPVGGDLEVIGLSARFWRGTGLSALSRLL